jgi:hypothetical protein
MKQISRGSSNLLIALTITTVIVACTLAFVRALMAKHAWQFSDPRNRAVFTTKGLLQTRQPVLRVFRDSDGDWQFLGAEEVNDSNCSIVGLGAIVDYDPSLAELARMPPGWCAYRRTTTDNWVQQEYNQTLRQRNHPDRRPD